MGSKARENAFVVVQLTGGNDALNTVIPHGDGLYYDFRPNISIPQEEVLAIDGNVGFNPAMRSVKRLWDEGNVAVIQGIGYNNPNRSHFRSMDIWHTAEPDAIGTEGWLGRTIRDLDPQGDNVLTAINFGRGLPRALACRDVAVTSVGDLATYGLYPDLEGDPWQKYALDAFSRMYGPEGDRGLVMDFLAQTGGGALRGAEVLKTASEGYQSTVEYGSSPIAQRLRDISRVLCADVGTRVYYTQHGNFDTHSGLRSDHGRLWNEVDGAVGDFWDDVKEHGREDQAVMMIFTEFGRRIADNGTGCDHGAGGVALVIGGAVKGGLYGEFPSLKPGEQIEGDMKPNNDFRSTYSTVLERWLGVEAAPIVNGGFEQLDFLDR